MQRPVVFISYTNAVRRDATLLANTLDRSNVEPWTVDFIPLGAVWESAIRDAIGNANAIVFMTHDGQLSQHQLADLRQVRLQGRGIPIVPIAVGASDFPAELRHLQGGRIGNPADVLRLAEVIADLLLDSVSRKYVLPPPPAPLVDALQSQRCIVYIGSGLSQPAGYPTWSALAENLLDWASDHELLSLSMVRSLRHSGDADLIVDSVASATTDRDALIEQLRTMFPPVDALPRYYQLLQAIRFCSAFTTNYDRLTEEAMRHWPVLTPDDAEQLLGRSNEAGYVLKLYGNLDDPKSVMLSTTEYEVRVGRNRLYSNFIEGILNTHTMLFVGASLEGIENYLAGIPFSLTSVEPRHFAIVNVHDDTWESRAALLERRYGIRTLPFTADDEFSQLSDFLDQLRQVTRSPVTTKSARGEFRLEAVELWDIGPFEHIRIPFDKRLNVLVGDNGIGKSTVLRAIATLLSSDEVGPWGGRLIRSGAASGTIKLSFSDDLNFKADIRQVGSDLTEISVAPRRPLERLKLLCLAFPAIRSISWNVTPQASVIAAPTVDDVIPILWDRPDYRPDSFRDWLVQLQAQSLDAPEQAEALAAVRDEAFDIINRLTDGLEMSLEKIEVQPPQVWVRVDGHVIPLASLSQGTLGLIGWVGVLCRRLHDLGQPLRTGRALVLIDEIDAHMHPKWQRTIIRRFMDTFQNVQIVATTHSPLIVGGLDPEQVHRFDRGRLMPIDPEMTMGRPDQVLASQLFGLEPGFDQTTEELIQRWHELDARDQLDTQEQAELERLTRTLELRVVPPHVAPSERTASRLVDALIEDAFGERLPDVAKTLRDRARQLIAEVEEEASR